VHARMRAQQQAGGGSETASGSEIDG